MKFVEVSKLVALFLCLGVADASGHNEQSQRPDKLRTNKCDTDADCNEGMHCSNGLCIKECIKLHDVCRMGI